MCGKKDRPDNTVFCNETNYCYDDNGKGLCVNSCEVFPRIANSTCNCNSNNTCLEHETCVLESGECKALDICEDLVIMTTDHCNCVDALYACNVTEYCHKDQKACVPAPLTAPLCLTFRRLMAVPVTLV